MFANLIGLKQLSIKIRFTVILTILILGFALFGLATFKAMSTLNVNGPLYQRIVQGHDVLADVLPPPEYILESYNLVLQSTNTTDPSKIDALISRFQQLKTEYDQRHQYWVEQNLEQPLKTPLLEDSYQFATKFYQEAEAHFFPAIKANDHGQWSSSLQTLEQAYEQHRQAIDQVVSYSNERNHQDEMQAQQAIDFNRALLIGIFSISVLIAIVLTVFISRGILASLQAARQVAGAITSGDLKSAIDVSEKSEIGELLRSLSTMQQQILDRCIRNDQLIEESTRLKMALDSINANVMVADTEGTIIYLNPAIILMLKAAEAQIRKSIAHFDVGKLMGSSMDIFHKNPAHQREVLARMNATYKTEIEVTGLIFSLIANVITNSQGQKIGAVVEWVDRTMDKQIEKEVANAVGAAVLGDFSQTIPEQAKQGFSLLLAQSINKLLATNSSSLADLVRVLDALSTGDLNENIDKDYAGTYGQLKDSANTTVANLRKLIRDIKNSTDTINTAAKEISSGNNDLSHRTEQQAASLEETAASMEQLTSTVEHNAENAKQANEYAVSAADIAGKGVEVVNQVVSTMNEINTSSHRISDIISVIDDIAFQTNILALNAAVEAARAGEQGKGFAVVAIEVRNLAQRAASAAGEIKRLIDDSVEKVNGGSKLVANAGKTMEEIVGAIQRVTSTVAEITSASSEQSSGIGQVNQAIGQMDDVTQQNAALVEQAAAAAESLEEQTQQLAIAVGTFKLDGGYHHGLGTGVRSADPGRGVSAKIQTYKSSSASPSKPQAPVKQVSAEAKADLDMALQKHAEWKVKLRTAITQRDTLDASTISKDNCCDFGKWLHGDALSHLGHLASYKECVLKHAAFHVEAGKIAALINDQKYDEADQRLGMESVFNSVSSEVGSAIIRLKKDVGAPKTSYKPVAAEPISGGGDSDWEEF